MFHEFFIHYVNINCQSAGWLQQDYAYGRTKHTVHGTTVPKFGNGNEAINASPTKCF